MPPLIVISNQNTLGTEPRFESKGGSKYELKKFQVTQFIKKKNHGRPNNCTLLPKYLSQEGNNMN